MALKLGKRWNRLNLEMFEERVNPDATFGWELVAAGTPGVQPGLYFRLDGDMNGQAIADTVTLQNDPAGGVMALISTASADDGTPLDYPLSISGGEIALARQAFAMGGSQPAFRGFHVLTYDGNDTVSAGPLPYAVWAEGGSGNDALTGGNVADRLDGGTGGPVGSPGNDTINGGAGSDVIVGGDGNDNILGGSGNDTITTLNGNSTILGGSGNDTITTGDGTNTVDGGTGHDTITTGGGADTVFGGDGDDTISTGGGNDTVIGGAGADAINAGDGTNNVDGGDGNDTITTGSGNDTVNGGAGNDTISTGAGNDTVTGGPGADAIDAGAGNDTVNADTDDTVLQGGSGTDTLVLSGDGAITIDGNTSGFEVITVAAGSNPAITFMVPTAAFTAVPPPNYSGFLNSNDTLSFQNAPTGQTVDMNNLPFGLAASGIASVIGSTFNDFITGTAGNDRIDGGAGDDVVSSGAGNDTVNGGVGNDFVMGGEGNDILTGGAGNDTVLGGDGDDNFLIEWSGGALNTNDIFLGQGGYDTMTFSGVPDADGNPNNGIQPSSANMATIFTYISGCIDTGKMDWNIGPSGDNPTIQFVA